MRMQPRPAKPCERWNRATKPGAAIVANPKELGYGG